MSDRRIEIPGRESQFTASHEKLHVVRKPDGHVCIWTTVDDPNRCLVLTPEGLETLREFLK